MADRRGAPHVAGPNDWLVEEMYEQYLENPRSVSESWQEFFEGTDGGDDRAGEADAAPQATAEREPAPPPAKAHEPEPEARPEPEGPPAAQAQPEPESRREPEPDTAPTPAEPASPARPRPQVTETAPPAEAIGAPAPPPAAEPLRGAAARIVANMEASLKVPTATSFREVPAKLLEVNRRVVNGYLGRKGIGKISFTHLIGYAVVRAIADSLPVMNSTFTTDDSGKPMVVRNPRVNLGIAVDVEKSDGSRTLVVPVVKNADTLDFRGFWLAYEELIRKVRDNRLSPDDFAGTTVTLTNPGTIGTKQSVPRLMPGQGCIVGVGSIDYPAAYEGADPAALADFGASKVLTLTSTYDHRIIQGAESGLFLRRVHELLLGADEFYDKVFRSLGVPYEAVRWRRDVNPVDREDAMLGKQAAVDTLIRVHRVRGHLIADLDPLAWKEPYMEPELDPATYGLTIWDLDREFLTGGLGGSERLPLGEILRLLRDAYCRTIGIEYMHIQELDEQRWIQQHVEGVPGDLSAEDKVHVLEKLNAAEAFETFLGTKYIGQKRFGLEGAESAIPILDAVLEAAADDGLEGVVMGMAHRGRLNVLANIVGKSYDQIFREFEGAIDPNSVQGSGDVKYHLGQSGKFVSRAGNEIAVELSANPSHLEAVDPVVVGMARAKQDIIDRPEAFPILPVLLHGDAAFAGQGVVAETLQLGKIRGYRVGGTIHLVINNQLGFTTPPESARSSEYSTDIAKMVQAPIFHVNGDDPEACVRVARLAFDYRQRFHKDVVIDLVCYRRLGHNEGDDPSYTQPLMYKRIEAKRSARTLYTEALVKRGDISGEEAKKALVHFQARLQEALDQTRQSAPPKGIRARRPDLVGCLPRVETGVDRRVLDHIFDVLNSPPEGFTVHPKLAKQFEARARMWRDEGQVDWALGETMAFGSLLLEGTDIRLAGQDSRRGTFSQRHAVVVDYETGAEWVPLSGLHDEQAKFWIYDSLLSEYAGLGFEYGYSMVNKDAFVGWEAQFGDFVNGAQIIIDQYIVAAEDKWGASSGLVMLLPHGYEGQGPEHSSARIERFLTLAAEDNIQLANCTSAAQYFHLLRRQLHRDVRKPLVVFTPKSLLRARTARSPIDDLTKGSFLEVLADPNPPEAESVTRIVLASGKAGVDAVAKRDELGSPVAVIRVEQLYPWPFDHLAEEVAKYPTATELVWLQEEPENMGPWNFVKGPLYESFDKEPYTIRRISRFESGSPATGSHGIHVQEQDEILSEACTA